MLMVIKKAFVNIAGKDKTSQSEMSGNTACFGNWSKTSSYIGSGRFLEEFRLTGEFENEEDYRQKMSCFYKEFFSGLKMLGFSKKEISRMKMLETKLEYN